METFTCGLCSKTFESQENLKSHIISDINKKEAIHQKSKFTCKTCNKLLSSKASLNMHILSVHEEKKMFKCSLCTKKYTNESLVIVA